mgnify:CR=1 FL=1
MEKNKIFLNSYDNSKKILTGTVQMNVVGKDDSKTIFDLIVKGINDNPSYNDYILDTRAVTDVRIESFGYLMKALGVVKKTAGYMILVINEDVLQKFMITNPEMFDYYAVFFSIDEAVQFIISKR